MSGRKNIFLISMISLVCLSTSCKPKPDGNVSEPNASRLPPNAEKNFTENNPTPLLPTDVNVQFLRKVLGFKENDKFCLAIAVAYEPGKSFVKREQIAIVGPANNGVAQGGDVAKDPWNANIYQIYDTYEKAFYQVLDPSSVEAVAGGHFPVKVQNIGNQRTIDWDLGNGVHAIHFTVGIADFTTSMINAQRTNSAKPRSLPIIDRQIIGFPEDVPGVGTFWQVNNSWMKSNMPVGWSARVNEGKEAFPCVATTPNPPSSIHP